MGRMPMPWSLDNRLQEDACTTKHSNLVVQASSLQGHGQDAHATWHERVASAAG